MDNMPSYFQSIQPAGKTPIDFRAFPTWDSVFAARHLPRQPVVTTPSSLAGLFVLRPPDSSRWSWQPFAVGLANDLLPDIVHPEERGRSGGAAFTQNFI